MVYHFLLGVGLVLGERFHVLLAEGLALYDGAGRVNHLGGGNQVVQHVIVLQLQHQPVYADENHYVKEAEVAVYLAQALLCLRVAGAVACSRGEDENDLAPLLAVVHRVHRGEVYLPCPLLLSLCFLLAGLLLLAGQAPGRVDDDAGKAFGEAADDGVFLIELHSGDGDDSLGKVGELLAPRVLQHVAEDGQVGVGVVLHQDEAAPSLAHLVIEVLEVRPAFHPALGQQVVLDELVHELPCAGIGLLVDVRAVYLGRGMGQRCELGEYIGVPDLERQFFHKKDSFGELLQNSITQSGGDFNVKFKGS